MTNEHVSMHIPPFIIGYDYGTRIFLRYKLSYRDEATGRHFEEAEGCLNNTDPEMLGDFAQCYDDDFQEMTNSNIVWTSECCSHGKSEATTPPPPPGVFMGPLVKFKTLPKEGWK